MPKTDPIYSVKETDRKVYHDNSACTERNNIERENVRKGTDGRPVCKNCADLTRDGK